jgi:hypothetical protein
MHFMAYFLGLLVLSSLSWAQDKQSVPILKSFNNGCGSGWNERLIPDQLRGIGVNFSPACARHDDCYSKCLPGGENFGKPVCEEQEREKREGRRTTCDDNFFNDMNRSCSNAACRGMAYAYFVTVRFVAGGNFQGIEIPPQFYDFIRSKEAESFDFGRAAQDLEKLSVLPTISTSNRLVLDVAEGRFNPRVVSTTALPKIRREKFSNGIFVENIPKYGDIDLSGAKYKGFPFKVDQPAIKILEPGRLRNEQVFQLQKNP